MAFGFSAGLFVSSPAMIFVRAELQTHHYCVEVVELNVGIVCCYLPVIFALVKLVWPRSESIRGQKVAWSCIPRSEEPFWEGD